MCRQLEVNASMRTILVKWLVELYDELELPADALLHGIFHVDRFLSLQAVPKESLQLVGAVALMLATNHFCKLPHMDGEPPANEHALNHADDIVYWTDGTYTVEEVFTMESRLLVGFEIGAYESPLSLLAQITVDVPIDDATASLAFEILVQCARHYELLRLTPRILASCALYLALKNTQSAPGWSDELADRCGFSTEAIDQAARHHLHELDGEDLKCRSLASITRERTYAFTLLIKC